jgi:S-adenosylmethionine:diacylglycerol 3-amino-3-carboxypropyl transferase
MMLEHPKWIQDYWVREGKIFKKGFYQHGVFSKVSSILRRFANIDEKWLRKVISKPKIERRQLTDEFCTNLMKNSAAAAFLESPVVLLGCGINFRQRSQNLHHWKTETIQDVFINLGRKMSETNCEDNWILWHSMVGQFDHDNPKCAPPYLRPNNHKMSLGSPTKVNYNLESIFKTLGRAGPDHWSHYNLSDIADWMPEATQRQLFLEVHRTAKDESHLLFRSVEDVDLIDKLGLSKYFHLVKPASKKASLKDRSSLYQRVNLYRKVS